MRAPLASIAAGLLALSLQAGSGVAQTVIESQRVAFPAGAASTALKGQLKGDQTVDYKLRAGAGQIMTVDLKGSNLQNYFNVIAAGSDSAMVPVNRPASIGLTKVSICSGVPNLASRLALAIVSIR